MGAKVWLLLMAMAAALGGCHRGYQSIEVPDGGTRRYILTVPESYSGEQPVPLLIALHQFSDTAAGMQRLSRFDDIAAREGFLVCYPQGKWRIWNAGQRDGADDVAFLNQLVEEIAQRYNVDRALVYATGISAGGMMSQYWACKGGKLAAIACVAATPSAGSLDNCTLDGPLPVLLMHGTEDSVVPFNGGGVSTGGGDMTFMSAAALARSWAERNGCGEEEPTAEVLPPLQPDREDRVTRFTFHCPADSPVVYYEIGGAGHTWPGGDNWYPRFIVGETSQQIDASGVIWDFFKAH